MQWFNIRNSSAYGFLLFANVDGSVEIQKPLQTIQINK